MENNCVENQLNHKWKKNSIDGTKAREDPNLSINHSLMLIEFVKLENIPNPKLVARK